MCTVLPSSIVRPTTLPRTGEWPAAMITFRNRLARVNYWRKFGSTWPNRSRSTEIKLDWVNTDGKDDWNCPGSSFGG